MALNINVYDYDWVIESVDLFNHTMIVKYTHAEEVTMLNVPIPLNPLALNDHIQFYAPTSQWDIKRAKAETPECDWAALLNTSGSGVTSTTTDISSENQILPAFDFLVDNEVIL